MEIVFFLYGLSFLALGTIVSVRYWIRGGDLPALRPLLPWLAGFSFVHGALEWSYLLPMLADGEYPALPAAQASLLFVSYLLLFEFGRGLLLAALPERSAGLGRRLLGASTLPILVAIVAAGSVVAHDFAFQAVILTRYLIGTTASVLAAAGFFRYVSHVRGNDADASPAIFRVAGASCLAYGVFGGLVVPHADWMPAAWLDEQSFRAMLHVPVQLFRMGCAVLMAFAIGAAVYSGAALKLKIWLLMTTAVVLIMSIDLFEGVRGIEAGIHDELSRDARDIRAILMATRRVYHQQFIASGLDVTDKTVGFLPAHALSRISREFPNWSRSGLRFNNVSDKPRNPANRADEHELEAMAFFRANPTAEERLAEIEDAGDRYYHYTAPIWIEQYCLQCHGTRERAPPSIAQNYDAAYGYRVGDLRGVMSIKLPMKPLRQREYGSWFSHFAIRFAGYTLLTLLLVLFLNRAVIARLGRLEQATGRLAEGDYSARSPAEGYDELSRLARSFNAMGQEIQDRDDERRRMVDELRDAKENLEIIVADRTAELVDYAKRLEAANAELESFSYSVSHDLRAPLRALNGYAHILRDEQQGRLNAEGEGMLERIMQNATKMGVLIDDILRFSRVGRTDMDWREVDMAAMARSVADELCADYPAAAVHIEDLPTTTGDSAMLRQVWSNLIGNALKFSANKENPRIEIGSEVHAGETVYYVRDNGAGFDMAYAAKLFEVFQRLHPESEFAGTGAGLAIVKRIIERHSGRIWAESKPGEGAIFRFTLAG